MQNKIFVRVKRREGRKQKEEYSKTSCLRNERQSIATRIILRKNEGSFPSLSGYVSGLNWYLNERQGLSGPCVHSHVPGCCYSSELSLPSRFVAGWKKLSCKITSIPTGKPTFHDWLIKWYKVQPFASLETTLMGLQLLSSCRICGGFAATALRFHFCFILLAASLAGADPQSSP